MATVSDTGQGVGNGRCVNREGTAGVSGTPETTSRTSSACQSGGVHTSSCPVSPPPSYDSIVFDRGANDQPPPLTPTAPQMPVIVTDPDHGHSSGSVPHVINTPPRSPAISMSSARSSGSHQMSHTPSASPDLGVSRRVSDHGRASQVIGGSRPQSLTRSSTSFSTRSDTGHETHPSRSASSGRSSVRLEARQSRTASPGSSGARSETSCMYTSPCAVCAAPRRPTSSASSACSSQSGQAVWTLVPAANLRGSQEFAPGLVQPRPGTSNFSDSQRRARFTPAPQTRRPISLTPQMIPRRASSQRQLVVVQTPSGSHCYVRKKKARPTFVL
ncbi:hypothetical protein BaRGS_00010424 [Batillaria attramentaria]|uniref:Uncharacterized protein n=1 Tax=Batillaria attramentaria TaxID=370345 RepID=A0ABD0LF13_9CAEN